MPILKSQGVTETEKFLSSLCERSFLKLWSYPNLFNEDRKELCDLLAVFESHVLIFFDRKNMLSNNVNGDPIVNWNRWKRKVIDSQIRTASGAEQYIKNNHKIFLDVGLTQPFPIPINTESMIVHKIIVAHGAKEACLRNSEKNIYGSLAITYSDNCKKTPDFPFMVNIDRNQPVHIFDSHNLPIIFSELDTIFDFLSYLDAKLEAIKKFNFLTYCGEEDLLANYFLNFDKKTNRHYVGTQDKKINGLFICEGEWKDFINRDEYNKKKSADKVSYLWDELIQRTCEAALAGTHQGNVNIFHGPSAIHEMAKEPRFMRRELSNKMIESIRNFPESNDKIVRSLCFMPSFYKGKSYVFLQLKVDGIKDYENEYRPRRRAILEIACGVIKNKFKDLKTVIGIAIDAPKFAISNSEDFILMDCSRWSDDERNYYKNANEKLKLFGSTKLKTEIKDAIEFPSDI